MFRAIKKWWNKHILHREIDKFRFMSSNDLYTNGPVIHIGGAVPEEAEDTRLDVNGLSTLICEIETQVEFSTDDLDSKIKLVEERIKFFRETLRRLVPSEYDHALQVLQARKKYPKLVSQFKWKTTTKDKIDALCKKYKVHFGEIANFLPDLPEAAIQELEGYKKVWEKAVSEFEEKVYISLWVIAPASMFKTRKGDPILLAKSPFGDFYYVICAWDKEVEFVKDLLS